MKPLQLSARVVIVTAAALTLGSLTVAIARRIFFPYPLEWMEGVVLEHALRIVHGQPIYGPPAASFVPLVYAPVSYGVMAAFLAVLGGGLATARAASVAATVVTLVAIGAMAARRTPGAGRWGALLAVGLYAAGFAYGGTFFDLCRVDAIALAFLAGGVALIDGPAGRGRASAGFVLVALSVLARQQHLAILAAVSLAAAWDRRLRAPAVVGWLVLGLATAGLLAATHGWFWTYAVTIPRGHPFHPGVAIASLVLDFAMPLPALAVAAAVGVGRARAREPLALALLGGIVASALARGHEGGFDNVLLTGFVLLVPMAASVMARALFAPSGDLSRTWRVLVLAGIVGQVLVLYTPPGAYAPTRADRVAWQTARRIVRLVAGGRHSVALDHTGLGDTPFAHTMAISDVLSGAPPWLARQTRRVIVEALDPTELGAIAVGDAIFPALGSALRRRYEPATELPALPLMVGHDPGTVRIHGRPQGASFAGALQVRSGRE